jgi:hypothetical protein
MKMAAPWTVTTNLAQAFDVTTKYLNIGNESPEQIKIERRFLKNSLLFSLFSGKITVGCRQAVCLPIRTTFC